MLRGAHSVFEGEAMTTFSDQNILQDVISLFDLYFYLFIRIACAGMSKIILFQSVNDCMSIQQVIVNHELPLLMFVYLEVKKFIVQKQRIFFIFGFFHMSAKKHFRLIMAESFSVRNELLNKG